MIVDMLPMWIHYIDIIKRNVNWPWAKFGIDLSSWTVTVAIRTGIDNPETSAQHTSQIHSGRDIQPSPAACPNAPADTALESNVGASKDSESATVAVWLSARKDRAGQPCLSAFTQ